ncbi:MAG: hypothetical protein IPP49_18110 [Saprospiraceae bacterium]|nr:hypothetical protein [Saprospiraceae bacterium]
MKSNAGSPGVDGIDVKEFGNWFRTHHGTLKTEILNGDYRPSLVRGVEIPKPKGGKRLLGIPTVKDRVVQQAISQVLVRYYEVTFTESSRGFRP